MEQYCSYMELLQEINVLKRVFQNVRIIEPITKKEVIINPNSQEPQYISFECIRPSITYKECKFCIIDLVFEEKTEYVKYDVFEDHIYMTIARCIVVGEKYFVLELIKSVHQSHLLDEIGEAEFLQRFRRLEEGIYVDELTGVYNRRFINENLPAFILEAESTKDNVGLAMIDVDYFKEINDGYGHLLGDQVLCKIASTIYNSIDSEQGDFIARYGGDEFILVLKAKSHEENIKRMLYLNYVLQNMEIYQGENKITFSLSIGYSHNQEFQAPTVGKLMELSDKRLYQAKRQGRNQIVTS